VLSYINNKGGDVEPVKYYCGDKEETITSWYCEWCGIDWPVEDLEKWGFCPECDGGDDEE